MITGFSSLLLIVVNYPSEVSKEESAFSVVRIGVRVRVLVMYSMAHRPGVEGVLDMVTVRTGFTNCC